jgi:putative zinc finger protein
LSVVDLHPEDLIEREAAGPLDAADRARLDAHLARCTACRIERKLRADFVAELSAELPSHSFGLLAEEAAEEGNLARESRVSLRGAGDGGPSSTRRRSTWPRRRTAKTAWLLAAAALLVGGVATAMGLADGDWPQLIRRVSTPDPAPADVRPPDPPRAKVRRMPNPLPELPAPVETVTNTPAPVAPAVPPRVLAPAPRPLSISIVPPPVEGPAELLDSASSARRRGEYGRALDIHRDLEARYPTSREAQVSRAIAGRLLLDRGDPARALANFDSYLAAGSGDLREETMVGRATALDRLGRDDEAARAWRGLLTAFPETPYAPHARARSESLNSH